MIDCIGRSNGACSFPCRTLAGVWSAEDRAMSDISCTSSTNSICQYLCNKSHEQNAGILRNRDTISKSGVGHVPVDGDLTYNEKIITWRELVLYKRDFPPNTANVKSLRPPEWRKLHLCAAGYLHAPMHLLHDKLPPSDINHAPEAPP